MEERKQWGREDVLILLEELGKDGRETAKGKLLVAKEQLLWL